MIHHSRFPKLQEEIRGRGCKSWSCFLPHIIPLHVHKSTIKGHVSQVQSRVKANPLSPIFPFICDILKISFPEVVLPSKLCAWSLFTSDILWFVRPRIQLFDGISTFLSSFIYFFQCFEVDVGMVPGINSLSHYPHPLSFIIHQGTCFTAVNIQNGERGFRTIYKYVPT